MLYREWFVRFRFPGHEHVKITEGIPDGWEVQPDSTAFEGNHLRLVTTKRKSSASDGRTIRDRNDG